VNSVFQRPAGSNLLDQRPRYIDALPIAVYACDAAGALRWYNARAAQLWGTEPRVGIASSLVNTVPEPVAEVLRSGTPVDGAQAAIHRTDGSSFLATMYVEPVADSAGCVVGAVTCFHQTNTQRHGTGDRDQRYGELLDALPAAIYTTDAQGTITAFNRAAVELWGREPKLGSDRWSGAWKLFAPDGAPMPPDQSPTAVMLRENRAVEASEAIGERPDGSRYWMLSYPTPLRSRTGELIGGINMLVDITNRKTSLDRIETLSREVNHRAKNMLAVIQSIIRLSTTEPNRDFAETLLGRITALGRAHRLLSDSRWQSADLARLIDEELAPFREGADARAILDGPHLALAPSAAQPLSIAVHELATNAAKYGALSVPGGRVSVQWSPQADGGVVLNWTESGGPPVTPPPRRNFGLNVISIVIGNQLGGTVAFDWRPDGLVCTAVIPPAALAR
jgi:PAS domain S-box-containing protein